VIFEEYTKNREVWRCPSARLENGAGSIIGYLPDWLSYLQSQEGNWGQAASYDNGGPCYINWPRGWGGDVTDSIAQQRIAGWATGFTGGKPFIQSIGTASYYDMKMVEVEDPVNFYICGDGGAQTAQLTGIGIAAYPDICSLECSGICGWADWVICTWAQDCGLYEIAPNDGSFITNPELRKPYSRHLGGVNCGFLDGHAQWMQSDLLVTKCRDGDIRGLDPWAPTAADDSWVSSCFPNAVYLM
jgi:prepilin-type processing-associated H-X9-DG protein